MITSRVGRLVGRLHIHGHINRIQLYGTSGSPRPSKPISFRLIVPPSQEAQRVTFSSADVLKKYVGEGTLCTLNSAGTLVFISPREYESILPSDIYSIATIYSIPVRDLENYVHTCSKNFEEKSRHAMVNFMKEQGMAFKELDRIIRDRSRVVAEWAGIFEVDGKIFFLECKHKVTNDVLASQLERMDRSMEVLKKPEEMGKVFVAGEYWEGGEKLMRRACQNHCGVLREKGKDMEVLP